MIKMFLLFLVPIFSLYRYNYSYDKIENNRDLGYNSFFDRLRLVGLDNIKYPTKNRDLKADKENNYGIVKGLINYTPIDITFDFNRKLIRGYVNLNFVWLEINNEENVKGVLNKKDFNVKIEGNEEKFFLKGICNGSKIEYVIDWNEKNIKGVYNGFPIDIVFRDNVNFIQISGYVDNNIVDLNYNKYKNEILGMMNNSPVEIKIENYKIQDFLKYFFILLKESEN